MSAASPIGGRMRANLHDPSLGRRRRLTDRIVTALCLLATVAGLFFLFSILLTLLWRGLPGLTLNTFTAITRSPGSGGGLRNAIVGSLIMTGLGTLIGTPVGLLVGTYLSEYGAGSRLAAAVRFVSDVLLSAPSILIGLFVYQVLVVPFGFSGWAGSVALAIIVVPIVVRTTEDMLRLIPVSMREAAAALGAPKWRVTVSICYRAALDGILTGILLAVARVAGETAPLLFTSLGNSGASARLDGPLASLPITIYQYAGSAYGDWVQLAWTGSLLVTAGVLAVNIAARLAVRRRA